MSTLCWPRAGGTVEVGLLAPVTPSQWRLQLTSSRQLQRWQPEPPRHVTPLFLLSDLNTLWRTVGSTPGAGASSAHASVWLPVGLARGCTEGLPGHPGPNKQSTWAGECWPYCPERWALPGGEHAFGTYPWTRLLHSNRMANTGLNESLKNNNS